MRLKPEEIKIIKELVVRFFGSGAEVYLFGSRTDDSKHGGDIDLLIRCDEETDLQNVYRLKMKFLVELKYRIGEQRIDLLIDAGGTDEKIIQSALETGIRL